MLKACNIMYIEFILFIYKRKQEISLNYNKH